MMFWCWRECWDEDQWQGKAGRIIFGIIGGAILTLFLLSLGLSAPIAVAPPFVSPDESRQMQPPQTEPVRSTVRQQALILWSASVSPRGRFTHRINVWPKE